MDTPTPPPDLGTVLPGQTSEEGAEPMMLCSLLLGLLPEAPTDRPRPLDLSGGHWFVATQGFPAANRPQLQDEEDT